MLAYTPPDESSLALLPNCLHDLLKHLTKNSATSFGAGDYEMAPLFFSFFFHFKVAASVSMDNGEAYCRVLYCRWTRLLLNAGGPIPAALRI